MAISSSNHIKMNLEGVGKVKAIPLQKATGGAVANFIKENIIVRFGVPYRIISDNGTPFVNSDVRKMLEFFQVKHHRSSPY